METIEFIAISEEIITRFYKEKQNIDLKEDEIFVVWSCKTLQNNKAILGTSKQDNFLFEVCYNGDQDEIYFDVYDKITNQLFKR